MKCYKRSQVLAIANPASFALMRSHIRVPKASAPSIALKTCQLLKHFIALYIFVVSCYSIVYMLKRFFYSHVFLIYRWYHLKQIETFRNVSNFFQICFMPLFCMPLPLPRLMNFLDYENICVTLSIRDTINAVTGKLLQCIRSIRCIRSIVHTGSIPPVK